MASLTELRAFHLVAEAQSFSQAAREAAVSQSTLSIQVKRLEQSSGRDLFERLPRGVRLTPTGVALFETTSRMFEAESAARRLLTPGSLATGGRLRMVADGPRLPARALAALRRLRPDLQFSLDVAHSTRVVEDLAAFRADVGISAHAPEDDRFHAEAFVHSPLELWLPRDHPLTRQPRVALAEAMAEPLVLRGVGSQTRAVLAANLARIGARIPAGIEVGQQDAVRELVAAGFGLGFGSAQEPPRDPAVVTRPLEDCPVTLAEYALCLVERRRSPLVRSFLQAVREIDWRAPA